MDRPKEFPDPTDPDTTLARRKATHGLEIAESIVLPVPKPFFPKYAVGIEDAIEEVIKLLTTEDESTVVVVIWGFGGIGKTTLAKAVVATLNLDGYNYARVRLDGDIRKNELKKIQEQILRDAFPSFYGGSSIKLRDCQEGQDRLKEAFLCPENKPVFLFIDNARSEELKALLPGDLSDLPKRSRILLTTRKVDQTDVFLSLRPRTFAMKTLEKDDAVEILFKDPDNREHFKDDMERILRICGGVPLALTIVRGHLDKTKYVAGKCSQILDALDRGDNVKEENLIQRVIESVYKELEEGTKDAFLDICCFFNGWIRRHVEYIVGVDAVTSLKEAALVSSILDDDDIRKVDSEEQLIVHDIVRAKGRAISASTRFMDESFSEAEQDETPAPTVEEVIDSLKAYSDTTDLYEFVSIIKRLLEEKESVKGSTSESVTENRDMWISFVTSGAKFLEFVDERIEKTEDKKDICYYGNSTVVAEILGEIGQLHWTAGALAITTYLIEKCDKVSTNNVEALELLSSMVDLVTTLIKLRDVIPKEELKNAVMLVVEGSIMNCSQIHSQKLFSFLKTSINSQNLKKMSNKLGDLYRHLDVTISKPQSMRHSKMSERQSEIAKLQSINLPVPKPFYPKLYPKHAVGIEEAREEVTMLLNMTTEDESTLVVVIHGFGGIGKTTLANAVVAMLNLDGYNYVRVQSDEHKNKNDLKKMLEIILKQAVPVSYGKDRIIDCQHGRDRLKEVFQLHKPIFLFIDNHIGWQDLRELLPLADLPKRSRILLTTRKLEATDVFLTSGIKCNSFAMKTLKEDHAVNILCKNADNRERIKDDLERILRICGGAPLALTIVGGHLVKTGFDAGKCCQILDALDKEAHAKEDNMRERLIDFVYNDMEDGTKDAFLDICCFFNGWLRRHVEYVVRAEEVQWLEEAALLTPFVDDNMETFDSGEERINVPDTVRAKGQAMSASTRFTDGKSFLKVAGDKKKLKAIKGIWFDDGDEEYMVDVKLLNSMRHSLRILHLGQRYLIRHSSRILHFGLKRRKGAQSAKKFKELRYLQVPRCNPHLPMKVEELDMLGWMESTTNDFSVSQLPKRLSFLKTDDLYPFERSFTQGIQNHCLQELRLFKSGPSMMQLLEGLHQLSSLKILLLDGCYMKKFPEKICSISSLTNLSIIYWRRLKRLPQSFGRLKGLTHLQINYCIELEELPSSFGELTALEHLDLQYCPNLKQELPGCLESLKYLRVTFCEHLSVESSQSTTDYDTS